MLDPDLYYELAQYQYSNPNKITDLTKAISVFKVNIKDMYLD